MSPPLAPGKVFYVPSTSSFSHVSHDGKELASYFVSSLLFSFLGEFGGGRTTSGGTIWAALFYKQSALLVIISLRPRGPLRLSISLACMTTTYNTRRAIISFWKIFEDFTSKYFTILLLFVSLNLSCLHRTHCAIYESARYIFQHYYGRNIRNITIDNFNLYSIFFLSAIH